MPNSAFPCQNTGAPAVGTGPAPNKQKKSTLETFWHGSHAKKIWLWFGTWAVFYWIFQHSGHLCFGSVLARVQRQNVRWECENVRVIPWCFEPISHDVSISGLRWAAEAMDVKGQCHSTPSRRWPYVFPAIHEDRLPQAKRWRTLKKSKCVQIASPSKPQSGQVVPSVLLSV